MISRRFLLVALGMSALSALRPSLAQRQVVKLVRIGFLRFSDQDSAKPYVESFRQGLRNLGYVEGKDFVLELRFASGKIERFPSLTADLVKLKVDVIVTTDTPATHAAQQATTTIPIVMVNVIDPVGSGFVKSFARPGGNITGYSSMSGDVSVKHIEFLALTISKLSLIAVLLNPANLAHPAMVNDIQASAGKVGIKTLPIEAETPQKIEEAFAAMTMARAGAVIVVGDAFFTQQRHWIAELATRHRLPSITANREFVEAGVLMSYGQDFQENVRRVAKYVDKILKGAKPGDLAVERPTKFDLVMNRKTATVLGLTIPQELLLRADEVIE
ncbi:MAG: ABC transporter substrate-binding protein [Candidatus Binataceae bacterium]